jgi:hypothetical protein
MPTTPAATPRRKKTPGSPGASRQRKRSGASARSPLAWRLRPIIVVAVGIFLIAYILDWSAVARLVWTCLAGELGPFARFASFAILCLFGCILAWAWRPPAPATIVKVPRKARRPAAPPEKAARSESKAGAAPRTAVSPSIAENNPRTSRRDPADTRSP